MTTPEVFTCDVCLLGYDTERELRMHLALVYARRAHHRPRSENHICAPVFAFDLGEVRWYRCKLCGATLSGVSVAALEAAKKGIPS